MAEAVRLAGGRHRAAVRRRQLGARAALSRDNPFKKGTDANYSGEVYKIASIKPGPAPRFYLQDWDAEPVVGHWYANELQLVDPDDPTATPEAFLVETVLKRRTRKGIREVFVKWLGWPEKYNGWIPESDVTQTFE